MGELGENAQATATTTDTESMTVSCEVQYTAIHSVVCKYSKIDSRLSIGVGVTLSTYSTESTLAVLPLPANQHMP
jgi:hypothetical protein